MALIIRSNFQMKNPLYAAGTGRGIVLIGKSTEKAPLTRVSMLADAETQLGKDSNTAKMVDAALKQRPQTLYTIGLGALTTPETGAYKEALIKGASADGVYFYVIDDTSEAIIAEVKEFLAWCNTNAISAVVIVGGNADLVTKTDHYRIWVMDDIFADFAGNAVPTFMTAAASAAAIANERDLSLPFGSIPINGFTLQEVKHLDTLRTQTEAGLMSFVRNGTRIEIFQGVTSYVNPSIDEMGLKDPSVVCTADEIVVFVEGRIAAKHNRIKMNRLQDIADTIYSALDEKAAPGVEKIFPPNADEIIVQPDPQKLGKANANYHFRVIAGLTELEIGVTGEVSAQNTQ